jgi:sugar O-acyltransferase (sialic acid O-acetyltransferase NeuD family)
MSQKVLIIGGIGSGTVIAQAIIDANRRGFNDIKLEGFLNDKANAGDVLQGIPVIGKQNKENVMKYWNQGYKFIYSLHRTDGGKIFVDLFYELGLTPDKLVTFIHPTAYIAPDTTINSGCVIMPYVMISSCAFVNINTLIMTGATIGHNTQLGKFNHIASQAVVGAHLKFGIGVHIGLNATVREYLTIGDYATLGMGAVLTKNINNGEIWAGNPAKFLRMAK